jgi:hypothetical protein
VDGLYLELQSFADMTGDRVLAVARAFDAHPHLRPVKVGGDPARIKVEPTMAAVFEQHGLPIEWLTVRRSGRYPDFEGGQIDLLPGRGSWIGSQEGGQWEYSLTGHSIRQHWLPITMSTPAAASEAAELFEELAIALDAAYGYAVSDTWRNGPLSLTFNVPGVFWLNYFGPSFVAHRPDLLVAKGARALSTGGALIRTTESPWQPQESGTPTWQTPLRTILGQQAFQAIRFNPSLPTIDEHVAASPGDMEMPWVRWLAKKATADQAKKHAGALGRLAKAVEGRIEPILPSDSVEWSTSFDLPDWQEFARYLTRKLKGDLTRAVGKAAIAVVTTAPLDDEGSILLDTQLGPIRLGWFIDDVGSVAAYVYGSNEVRDLCDQWFE